MKKNSAQAFFLILIFIIGTAAYSDHAILDNGKILYNVNVPDGAVAANKLVRVRTGSKSFGYDPRSNTVYKLPTHSVIERVRDYVSTSTIVGREKAMAVISHRHWDTMAPIAHSAPLIAPTPAPKATPKPIYASAQETPVPLNVVSQKIPLDERLNKQLDMFMKEQTTLVQDAATSMIRGIVSRQQVTQSKVELIQRQKSILERFYPQTTDTVRLAVEYWKEQLDRARQTGRFDLENL